jgi:GNAT superfamily N-acetyltransferase
MVIDDVLVFSAELQGLRRLANLPRPKVMLCPEDVPGALCLWGPGNVNGGHRDDVRLVPGSGVPIVDVLRAAERSGRRAPGGHVLIRGVAASFDPTSLAVLHSLGAQRDPDGPYTMMALDLRTHDDTAEPSPGLPVTVATDAESLAQLRSVVGQVYCDGAESAAAGHADEADFYHAPGTMTYLAVTEDGQAVSTGSILIVDGVANIWSVATLPAARGRGAASAIMRAACAEARRQGALVAALRTTEDLARPNGLYQRVGFSVVGHEHAWTLDHVDALNRGVWPTL